MGGLLSSSFVGLKNPLVQKVTSVICNKAEMLKKRVARSLFRLLMDGRSLLGNISHAGTPHAPVTMYTSIGWRALLVTYDSGAS